MSQFFHNLSRQRAPWLLLALSALGLELAALYFQYVMELNPCVLCVYERVAVLGVILAGLVAFIAPSVWLFRWSGILLWLASALWGLSLAMEHTGIQVNPSTGGSCDFLANYPSWAPFDQWLPQVFEPTGYCDEIQWQFLTLSMPQWMLVVYSIYLVFWLLVFRGQFVRKRSEWY